MCFFLLCKMALGWLGTRPVKWYKTGLKAGVGPLLSFGWAWTVGFEEMGQAGWWVGLLGKRVESWVRLGRWARVWIAGSGVGGASGGSGVVAGHELGRRIAGHRMARSWVSSRGNYPKYEILSFICKNMGFLQKLIIIWEIWDYGFH